MFNFSGLFLASEYTTLHAGKHGWLQPRNRFHPRFRDVHSRSIHAAFIARLRQQGRGKLYVHEYACNAFHWLYPLGKIL